MKFWSIIVAVLFLSAQLPVHAAALDPPTEKLMQYAAKYSGYKVPLDRRPRVLYLSPEVMAKVMCPRQPVEECPIEGFYAGGQTVYIVNNLSEDKEHSILVHEFVHWLQRMTNPESDDGCEQNARDEREAYDAQNRYLKEVEHSDDYAFVPVMVCR